MLRYADYDIVFQEIPGEVTLAINISGCPNGCVGCHSAYLQQDVGEQLDEEALGKLLDRYGKNITCVSFMGGDSDPAEVNRLANFLKNKNLKTAWYSGRSNLSEVIELVNFNYIKLGPYIEKYGSLKSTTTNQRLYRIDGTEMVDITSVFWKK